MNKKNVNSLFEGAPEELEELQLTEEEIGMVYSGEGSVTFVCSHCGKSFPDKATLKRHEAICPKNPDKRIIS